MKKLIYKIVGYINQYNPETKEIEQIFTPMEVLIENPTEKNIELAKQKAYNGEYTVEDDGVEETSELTQEQRIAELEDALALLLSGVTE